MGTACHAGRAGLGGGSDSRAPEAGRLRCCRRRLLPPPVWVSQLRSILPPRLHAQARWRSLPLRCALAASGGGVASQAQPTPTGNGRRQRMNVVTITGRLTKDPELAERSGSTVCDLRLAENGGRDDSRRCTSTSRRSGARPRSARSTCARAAWSESAVGFATPNGRPRTARSAPGTRSSPSESSFSTARAPARPPRRWPKRRAQSRLAPSSSSRLSAPRRARRLWAPGSFFVDRGPDRVQTAEKWVGEATFVGTVVPCLHGGRGEMPRLGWNDSQANFVLPVHGEEGST